MLGEIGIMAITAYGLYFGAKRITSKEYKVEKLWNLALRNYPHQTSIRNAQGHTFKIQKMIIEGDNITGKLFIPMGLSSDDFKKVVPTLERAFYGSVNVTSDWYIEIITGRKELC